MVTSVAFSSRRTSLPRSTMTPNAMKKSMMTSIKRLPLTTSWAHATRICLSKSPKTPRRSIRSRQLARNRTRFRSSPVFIIRREPKRHSLEAFLPTSRPHRPLIGIRISIQNSTVPKKRAIYSQLHKMSHLVPKSRLNRKTLHYHVPHKHRSRRFLPLLPA